MIKFTLSPLFLLQRFDSCCAFYTAQAKLSQANEQVALDAAHDEDGFSLFSYEAPANKRKFVRKRILESKVEKEEDKNEVEEFNIDHDFIW